MEENFIKENYATRVCQKNKEQGKIVCTECYFETKQIEFFQAAGIEQHFRRAHRGKKFDIIKSKTLLQELHFL